MSIRLNARTGGLLSGEVALITGGAGGIGLAIARRFIREGAEVILFDRAPERLRAAKAELGTSAAIFSGDVRSFDDNRAAVAAGVEAFGRISIFVGNAGIHDRRRSLRELPGPLLCDAFDELFGIDVKGYLLGAKAALDELVKSRGSIVFTCSISGLFPGYGGILYTSAKHAIAGLTRQLAVELAPDVRVNAVAPGYIPTDLVGLESFDDGSQPVNTPRPAADFLLGRVPAAEDYVLPYVMLAAREAANVMTGSIILADGGSSLQRTRAKPTNVDSP